MLEHIRDIGAHAPQPGVLAVAKVRGHPEVAVTGEGEPHLDAAVGVARQDLGGGVNDVADAVDNGQERAADCRVDGDGGALCEGGHAQRGDLGRVKAVGVRARLTAALPGLGVSVDVVGVGDRQRLPRLDVEQPSVAAIPEVQGADEVGFTLACLHREGDDLAGLGADWAVRNGGSRGHRRRRREHRNGLAGNRRALLVAHLHQPLLRLVAAVCEHVGEANRLAGLDGDHAGVLPVAKVQPPDEVDVPLASGQGSGDHLAVLHHGRSLDCNGGRGLGRGRDGDARAIQQLAVRAAELDGRASGPRREHMLARLRLAAGRARAELNPWPPHNAHVGIDAGGEDRRHQLALGVGALVGTDTAGQDLRRRRVLNVDRQPDKLVRAIGDFDQLRPWGGVDVREVLAASLVTQVERLAVAPLPGTARAPFAEDREGDDVTHLDLRGFWVKQRQVHGPLIHGVDELAVEGDLAVTVLATRGEQLTLHDLHCGQLSLGRGVAPAEAFGAQREAAGLQREVEARLGAGDVGTHAPLKRTGILHASEPHSGTDALGLTGVRVDRLAAVHAVHAGRLRVPGHAPEGERGGEQGQDEQQPGQPI